jgi:hypothetical protein
MIFNTISPIIISIEKMAEDEKKDNQSYPYLYYNNFPTKKEGSSRTFGCNVTIKPSVTLLFYLLESY